MLREPQKVLKAETGKKLFWIYPLNHMLSFSREQFNEIKGKMQKVTITIQPSFIF